MISISDEINCLICCNCVGLCSFISSAKYIFWIYISSNTVAKTSIKRGKFLVTARSIRR